MDELTLGRCGDLMGTLDHLTDQWVTQFDLTTFNCEAPVLKVALIGMLRRA